MRSRLIAMVMGVLLAVLLTPRSVSQPQSGEVHDSPLIAWTLVPAPARTQPSAHQDSAQDPGAGDQNLQRQPATQSFAGTILKDKDEDQYVLKASDNSTYLLDDQKRAGEFERQQVQVFGVLDSTTNMIQVRDIRAAY